MPTRQATEHETFLSSLHAPFLDIGWIIDASWQPNQGGAPRLVGVQSNFKCPQCTWDSQIISARKIEPLSRISSHIQERVESWEQMMQNKIKLQNITSHRVIPSVEPKPRFVAYPGYMSPPISPAATLAPRLPTINIENYPEVVEQSLPKPLAPRSVSSRSRESVLSRPNHGTGTRKTFSWQSFLKPNRGSSSHVSIPSFAFSACGKTLLLWNERGAGCYDLHNADLIEFRGVNACNVCMAAGGTNKCAIVYKSGMVNFLKFSTSPLIK